MAAITTTCRALSFNDNLFIAFSIGPRISSPHFSMPPPITTLFGPKRFTRYAIRSPRPEPIERMMPSATLSPPHGIASLMPSQKSAQARKMRPLTRFDTAEFAAFGRSCPAQMRGTAFHSPANNSFRQCRGSGPGLASANGG